MPWYRAGTVTVTNGSPVVTGAGTDFVSNTSVGEVFLGPDGRVYEIAAVVSGGELRTLPAYQGASAGGQAYGIQPTSSFARDLASAVAVLIASFAAVRDGVGQGLFPDTGLRFAADQDTSVRRIGDNLLGLTTGGVDRVVIDAAGRIGVGWIAPLALVDVLLDQAINSPLMAAGAKNDLTVLRAPYGPSPFTTSNAGARWGFRLSGASDARASSAKSACLYAVSEDSLGYNRSIGMALHTSAQDAVDQERLRITGAGIVRPGGDNVQPLGSSDYRWSVVYAGTGSIATSDARAKQQIGEVPDEWLDAWSEVEWVRYRFNDAVEQKGDKARWHIGLIAQQVRDAFSARGINAVTIGLLCHDEWEAAPAVPATAEVRDKNGEIITPSQPGRPARPAGDRYGLRYDECQAIEAAYQRRQIERLTIAAESDAHSIAILSERLTKLEAA